MRCPQTCASKKTANPLYHLIIRASLCLNNRGVQLLALGRFKEAAEVLEDAIYVLKSSGRVVPHEMMRRILKRKLNRAEYHLFQKPSPTCSYEMQRIQGIHVVSSEDCLSRLGRIDIFAQISLVAFRLEMHDDLNYTSALFLHNLALARISLRDYDVAARLLSMANSLLCKSSKITSCTVNTAIVVLGALQHCYGECGFSEGLKECQEKIKMLRTALSESEEFCPNPCPYVLAAAA
jgi:hypothetical protein